MSARLMWSSSDRAQVYARDARLDDHAPLTYLGRGEADALRQDARDGHLVCPFPECDQRELIVRAGSRRDHFAHRRVPTCAHSPESLMHLQGKAMIADWLRGLFGGRLDVAVEVPIGGGIRVADVLARSPRDRRMAFEIQYAALEPDEWQQRHDDYTANDVVDVWLWGHMGPHCRGLSCEHLDSERGISPAMLRCSGVTGRPLLWLNPEERELAVAVTTLDLDAGEDLARLNVGASTDTSWAFTDRRAAIALCSSVEEWSLDAAGPKVPTPRL